MLLVLCWSLDLWLNRPLPIMTEKEFSLKLEGKAYAMCVV